MRAHTIYAPPGDEKTLEIANSLRRQGYMVTIQPNPGLTEPLFRAEDGPIRGYEKILQHFRNQS